MQIAVSFGQNGKNTQEPLTRLLFVFDASNSMYGRWQSNIKMEVAKRLMGEMLDSLKYKKNLEVALRCYGHQKPYPPQDCDDTKLEVAFGNSYTTTDVIKNRIKQLNPSGTTPIALSLDASANDFPEISSANRPIRNIIILVTDGIEECKGDPCAVSMALQKKGIVLKPFVIGVGLNVEFKKAFECVGSFYDASTEEQFRHVLQVVISQALNNTTAQVNLIDAFGNASETNVGFTLYNEYTGAIEYNYEHTMNVRGVPDTLVLDPIATYRMVVHTIPTVETKGIKLIPGKHNIIPANTPQGSLLLKVPTTSDLRDLKFIVRKKGDMSTLNVQNMNKNEKYLVGKYDLEVLTLPRIYLPDIDISQNKTTTIQIPQPGMMNVFMPSGGYGAIYLIDGNELKWLYSFDEGCLRDNVLLQPGNYKIIWRSKGVKETINTIEKSFKIDSGVGTAVRLF